MFRVSRWCYRSCGRQTRVKHVVSSCTSYAQGRKGEREEWVSDQVEHTTQGALGLDQAVRVMVGVSNYPTWCIVMGEVRFAPRVRTLGHESKQNSKQGIECCVRRSHGYHLSPGFRAPSMRWRRGRGALRVAMVLSIMKASDKSETYDFITHEEVCTRQSRGLIL